MLPQTFNFTGADGTPIATFNPGFTVLQGSMEIFSNTMIGDQSGDVSSAIWDGDAFSPDQFAEVTFGAFTGALYAGVILRGAVGNDYYEFFAGTGLTRLYKVTGGVESLLGGSNAQGFSSGDVLRLEIEGNVITPYKNGVVALIGPVMDSDFASGQAGLWFYGNDSDIRVASLTVGNLGVPPAAGATLWPMGVL